MSGPTQCPVCSAAEVTLNRRQFSQGEIYRCLHCQVLFAWPFRSPGAAFYSAAGDAASAARHGSETCVAPDHPFARSRHVQSLLTSKAERALLDVGCGNGAFVALASRLGFKVTGIDFDQASLEIARSRDVVGCRLVDVDAMEFLRNEHERYSVVTCFDVVEHIQDVSILVEAIKERLDPGGIFCGFLPAADRLLFWSLNEDYERPPYHLTFWTATVWARFLERSGFASVCITPYGYGYLVPGMWRKAKKTMATSLGSMQAARAESMTRPLRQVAAGLTGLGALVERLFERGSVMYFEARGG